MEPLDPLGYGTLLLVDGRRAGAGRLADRETLERLLRTLAQELEPGREVTPLHVTEEDGVSVAVLLDEAQLTLHAFPAQGAFAFRAFSRHALSDGAFLDRVLFELHAGQFESAVKRRAVPMSTAAEAATKALAGERGYLRARLDDGPMA